MDEKFIYIASDHAGFKAKEEIKKILKTLHYKVEDLGTNSEDPADYPKYAQKLSKKLLSQNSQARLGILICGTGTGMCIAANKVKGIRAAIGYDAYSAKMARKDNDINVLCMRSRKFKWKKFKEIIIPFLETEFSNLKRYKKRINQIE